MAAESRAIEDRIRAIEDRLEIYNLIASHPPSADTGADYYTRAVYVEDGELDLGRGKAVAGNETIAAITRRPEHQAAIAGGLAHFAGLPYIELDGDRAVVTSYLQILTPHPTAEPHEVPNLGTSAGPVTGTCQGTSLAPTLKSQRASGRTFDAMKGASPRPNAS